LDQPNKIISGCVDGIVRIIDINTCEIIQSLKFNENPIKTVILMDNWLIAGGNDVAIKAINLQSLESKLMLGHTGWVNFVT